MINDIVRLSSTKMINHNVSILLHGNPGTGKTLFAYQLTHQINGILIKADFTKLSSKWVGETEKNINKL